MSRPGRAAFAADDVADARAGRPSVDLAAWAAGRGWEHLGQRVPSGFVSVVPRWPEHVFNCSRGELPGAGFAAALHELHELDVTPSGLAMPGTFHDVRSSGRWSWLGWWGSEVRDQPFPRTAVRAPATRVAVRVPPAALLPPFTVRRAEHFPRAGTSPLSCHGLDGFRLAGDVGPGLVATFLDPDVTAALHRLPHAFVQVEVAAGHLALVRNGYARPTELDALVDTAGVLGRALRSAVAAPGVRDPATALPPPRWADPAAPGERSDAWSEGWWDAYRTVARQRGLRLEDPPAFHRAFPDQPVPGRAQGVLRGPVAELGRDARLVWYADGVVPVDGWVRGAVVLPARPGWRSRAGGLLVPETGMWAEVVGGLAACWTVRRSRGSLAADALAGAAAATLARLGWT